jgi:hypothetical protein
VPVVQGNGQSNSQDFAEAANLAGLLSFHAGDVVSGHAREVGR